jgi:hypothetical protein
MVQIKVNNNVFEMSWNLSTTMNGWAKFESWFSQQIEKGYEEDENGDCIGYPLIEVKSNNLPQGVVIGIASATICFGRVFPDGTWKALWYCAPREENFIEFINKLRLEEYDYQNGEGIYSIIGFPKWTKEVD